MRKIPVFFILCLLLFSCKKEGVNTIPETLLYAKRGENPGIYDQQGRFIILRGVNYNVLGDYWQGNVSVANTKPYEENDLQMMASYGVNCVRLLFSWSKLEPVQGQYNQNYINQIKSVIETAAKYNIYVLLDMHHDAWGKYIVTPLTETCEKPNKGWDGAPDWATITDGVSTCTVDGSRESAPAVYHAFQNFWDNTNGIQDAAINAWKTLVKQTAKYSNVIGYDLLNELERFGKWTGGGARTARAPGAERPVGVGRHVRHGQHPAHPPDVRDLLHAPYPAPAEAPARAAGLAQVDRQGRRSGHHRRPVGQGLGGLGEKPVCDPGTARESSRAGAPLAHCWQGPGQRNDRRSRGRCQQVAGAPGHDLRSRFHHTSL